MILNSGCLLLCLHLLVLMKHARYSYDLSSEDLSEKYCCKHSPYFFSPQYHLFTFLFPSNNQVVIISIPVTSMQVSCRIYVQRMFSVLLFSAILISYSLSVIGNIIMFTVPITKYNDMACWSSHSHHTAVEAGEVEVGGG